VVIAHKRTRALGPLQVVPLQTLAPETNQRRTDESTEEHEDEDDDEDEEPEEHYKDTMECLLKVDGTLSAGTLNKHSHAASHLECVATNSSSGPRL
jgi:hypothetical protein